MFLILLLFGSSAAAATVGQQQQQQGDLEGDGTQKRYVYTDGVPAQEPTIIFPAQRSADLGPVELDYPVKMVQRFTDSDGNVQVVTSYSNRKDSDLPIYRNQQHHPSYQTAERSGVFVPPPHSRTREIEVEERSAPKAEQMSRTKTIRFPDESGKLVDHEEKTSYRDGNSKSFRTESSYDKSYKKPVKSNSRSYATPIPELRSKSRPESSYEADEKSSSASAQEESDEDVSYRSYTKPVKKEVNVPSPSDSKPVRRGPVSSKFRSAKRKSASKVSDDGPIRASKKADHALEPAGSIHVSDIESIESDEDGYDDSDGYDEHHGGVDVHHGVEVIGHGPGPGVYGHDHGHGHDKKFQKEHGEAYHHGEEFAKGEKGGKGHKSKESYDKGHTEKHGHEHNKGGKKIEEGEKKGHVDEHNSYHKGHQHHKGEKGTEKAHSKGHKKGHKTKGFRTVHHKDEYKKDEVFYDEEHDAGHEKHHGHEQGGHQEAKGGETKKGHLDSGYKDAVKGIEGEKKEGHSYEHSKGHEGQSGHKGHEAHKEGFAKGAGQKGEEAHGHVHESKGKGW